MQPHRPGPPEAVRWSHDGSAVDIIDQTLLPGEETRIHLRSATEAADAIRAMRVRGAPAIGIVAAMSLALEADRLARGSAVSCHTQWDEAAHLVGSARPTAVNLGWAVERMRRAASTGRSPASIARILRAEADAILREDRDMCRRIGEHALGLLPEPSARVLTHCNAGALATGGIGSALAPLYLAAEAGRDVHVYASETRPLLQGSRLTAWELARAGIDVTLVTDSTPALLMRERRIDLVLVGADRIAANGDVANKIGTYALAVLARHHGIPFYVAAPTSTVDAAMPDGSRIPIEVRDPDEVRRGLGKLTAPADTPVYSPAFDVTPAALVDAIITDRGVFRPPYHGFIVPDGGE
ncbi:MAG: S-methyl-5-thioribose-1-phosphate isomerase [Gemmatimonadetes bacterium]|nr:S-methyl-5-thioribose-1-phosphate isomerase [Gemmatimonadota bacterium]